MARQFSVIGDSNIRRNMTTMNMASRQAMSGCQIIDCPSLSDLENSFAAIRAESDVCIFQAVTHLLLIAPDLGTVQSTIDTLFHELSAKIVVLCRARPDLMVTLCPPMYRPWPLWYRHHLAEMASGFSQVFGQPNFYVGLLHFPKCFPIIVQVSHGEKINVCTINVAKSNKSHKSPT